MEEVEDEDEEVDEVVVEDSEEEEEIEDEVDLVEEAIEEVVEVLETEEVEDLVEEEEEALVEVVVGLVVGLEVVEVGLVVDMVEVVVVVLWEEEDTEEETDSNPTEDCDDVIINCCVCRAVVKINIQYIKQFQNYQNSIYQSILNININKCSTDVDIIEEDLVSLSSSRWCVVPQLLSSTTQFSQCCCYSSVFKYCAAETTKQN